MKCEDCKGSGRYIGLQWDGGPCQTCNGLGGISDDQGASKKSKLRDLQECAELLAKTHGQATEDVLQQIREIVDKPLPKFEPAHHPGNFGAQYPHAWTKSNHARTCDGIGIGWWQIGTEVVFIRGNSEVPFVQRAIAECEAEYRASLPKDHPIHFGARRPELWRREKHSWDLDLPDHHSRSTFAVTIGDSVDEAVKRRAILNWESDL